MNINKFSFLSPLFLAIALCAGCQKSAPTLSPGQMSSESASTQSFKDKLKAMSPQEVAQAFKSDPARARAMLMPPGMGNPALRLNPSNKAMPSSGPSDDGSNAASSPSKP